MHGEATKTVEPLPGTLCCAVLCLGQDTKTRCINGYWPISCLGVTLRWTSILSRGIVKIHLELHVTETGYAPP